MPTRVLFSSFSTALVVALHSLPCCFTLTSDIASHLHLMRGELYLPRYTSLAKQFSILGTHSLVENSLSEPRIVAILHTHKKIGFEIFHLAFNLVYGWSFAAVRMPVQITPCSTRHVCHSESASRARLVQDDLSHSSGHQRVWWDSR